MPISLTLSPSQIEYIAKPGAAITQVYLIKNESSEGLILTTSVESWLPLGTKGAVAYNSLINNPDLKFSLANADLQLGQSFRLAAGQSRQLILKINPDSNLSPGDYYQTFFVAQDSSQTTFDNPQVTAKIGSHILLSISNTSNPASQLSISQFNLLPRFKDVFLTPLHFQGQVDNSSSYFTSFSGEINITKNNKLITSLPLSSQNVLAQSSRSLVCLDNPNCTLQPPFWPGAYTATLKLASSSASATQTFYVFPFSPLLFLGLLTAVIWFFYKRRY